MTDSRNRILLANVVSVLKTVMYRLQKDERIKKVFPIALLLCIHYFMQAAVLGLADLGEVDYFGASLLFEAVWEPEFLILFLPLATLLYRGREEIHWKEIDGSGITRVLVFGAAAILAWYFSTYDLNRFFGQEHLFDRVVLILLCCGIWKHPVFAVLFTWFVTVIACQFQYPAFDFSWFIVDKRLVYDCLLLFLSFLLIRIFFKLPSTTFPTLILGLVGVFYAYAALVKLTAGPYFGSWVFENELSSLLIASNQYGWLRHVDDQILISIWKVIHEWDVLLSICAILCEASGILLLVRASFAKVALIAVVVLHTMILLTTGIFFWAWIIFDLLLLGVLVRSSVNFRAQLFGKENRLTAMVVFVGGFFMFRPIDFVWFDGRAAEPYTITAIGKSDTMYEVTPYYFSLYDLEMGQRRFHFLNPIVTLLGTYGSTTYEIASELRDADLSAYNKITSDFGRERFDQERAHKFTGFLEKYLKNDDMPSLPLRSLNFLSPPHHFLVGEPKNAFSNQEQLSSFQIFAERFFFDGEEIHSLPRTRVMSEGLSEVGPETEPAAKRF